jgi:crotonobetainyl-CoA:carnitine CoA-transferase CaiB-like acyl-CoA transferase
MAVSDVLVHNYSPAGAIALDLDNDSLLRAFPKLILTTISCYGDSGPYAGRLGFDPMAQAVSGAMAVTGREGDPPLRSGVPWVDYSTGTSAALGTVGALYERQATGRGRHVECSLLDTAVSCIAPVLAEAVVLGKERPRLANRPPYLGPNDLYRCRDGWLYASTVTPRMWEALARLVGRDELLADARLETEQGRWEHRDTIDPAIAAWMAERGVDDALRLLTEHRIPCGPMRTTAEVHKDPQVVARELLPRVEVDGLGTTFACRTPFRSGDVDVGEVPGLGAHTDDLCRTLLDYDTARIETLRATGVL